MEKDATDLGRQGYRIASTEEAALPGFGDLLVHGGPRADGAVAELMEPSPS